MTTSLLVTPVRLGFAPPPLEDEPLDGYLEHLARTLQVPTSTLLAHLSLSPASVTSSVRGVDENTAERLGTFLSLSSSQVHAMTLRRYAPVGLMPSGVAGGGPGPWLRRKGARFCSACFRERGGRWRLSWYLQWTYICDEHATVLDVVCPVCSRPPRTRRGGHPLSPALTGTTGAVDGGTATACVCSVQTLASADLCRDEAEKVLDFPVPEPFLLTQRTITERISSPRSVPHLGLERPSTEWLHDLAALTRLIAVNAPHDHIPDLYADLIEHPDHVSPKASSAGQRDDAVPMRHTFADWKPYLGLAPYSAPAARFTQASASRVAFPIFATLAATILTAKTAGIASTSLARLLPPETRRAAAFQSRARGISWPLATALWLGEHQVPPSRARTLRLGGDRFRPDGTERVPLDPARITARPWPAVRAALPWTARDGFTGLTLSTALLIAATSRPLNVACDLLDHQQHASRLAHETRRLFATVADVTGGDVFDDLLGLHDAMTTGEVPIDYQRRRHVFAQPVALAKRTAARVARELGVRPTPRLARFMSWWIHEQLTGNDILLHPDLLDLPGGIRAIYARQRTQWDDDPPATLLRRAEHALLVNCIDEPITWSPALAGDGTWVCPRPDLKRQLDWTSRRPRSAARPGPQVTQGLSLAEAVNLARSGQSPRTDRLARMLVRFQAVVDSPTIAQAAKRLDISQATLSRVIATLETDLGTSLFARTHQANVLTDHGHRLHRMLRIKPITHVDPARIRAPGPANPASPRKDRHA